MHDNVVESALVGYPHDIKGNALYAYVILKDDSKKEIRLTRLKRLEKKLKSNILKRKKAISKNG